MTSEPVRRRVLVVDDNPEIHTDFRSVLGNSTPISQQLLDDEEFLFGSGAPLSPSADRLPTSVFDIDTACQGQDAVPLVLQALHHEDPYTVVFVDGRMPPGWDGVETIEHLWEIDPRLQVVYCTAYSDHSYEQIVQRLGETDRLLIIKKPFDPDEVRLAAVTLNKKWHAERKAEIRESELENLVALRTHDVLETRDLAMFGLAKLAESRDNETGEHLERMRQYAQILAEYLSENGPYTHLITPEFLTDFYRSTPLHDVGKVAISDSILLKPGRLTPEEFDIMKTHSSIGGTMLEETAEHASCGGFLKLAAEIAHSHHERFDGSGYPRGLKGQDIPIAARIVAIADVYDAITSKRCYKDATPADEAKTIIESESGKHFDPEVVVAFVACFEQFKAIPNEAQSMFDVPLQISTAEDISPSTNAAPALVVSEI